MIFEASKGKFALWTRSHIKARFPNIETKPLERWKRAN